MSGTTSALSGRASGSSVRSPTVSVVVGTYNGERYLEQQLDSVVAQTYAPIEILVSDDGSTDDTTKLLHRFEGGAVPVHVHQNAMNLGFADNFLEAAARAQGEYVAFCDQDDIWFPEKLAVQVDVLLRTGAAAATHDTAYIDENGADIPHRGSRTGRRLRVLRENQLPPWGNFLGNTLVVRRSLLLVVPFAQRGAGPVEKEDLVSHDRWAYALAAMSDGIALIPQRLSAYRQHPQQLYGVRLDESAASPAPHAERAKLFGEARRLQELARFRADLALRGAPARNPRQSARRWLRIAEIHGREARFFRSPPRTRWPKLASGLIHGDFLPVRHGGLGPRQLLRAARS